MSFNHSTCKTVKIATTSGNMIRYDTIGEFNVDSKAERDQLNL